MTAIQINAQIWRDIAEIADNEPLMKQLSRYLKKLVAKKQDETLVSKEEFMESLERGEEEHDELMANWARLQQGEDALPIEPLK